MQAKQEVYEYIKEGKYQGLTQAARDLECSATTIFTAIQALLAEGKVEEQSKYKAN